MQLTWMRDKALFGHSSTVVFRMSDDFHSSTVVSCQVREILNEYCSGLSRLVSLDQITSLSSYLCCVLH